MLAEAALKFGSRESFHSSFRRRPDGWCSREEYHTAQVVPPNTIIYLPSQSYVGSMILEQIKRVYIII